MCTEGRCILHETQEAPVNNGTPLVNQDNCVKSEMVDGSENNMLVISDDDHEDHTDSWNVICDIKLSFGMASDVYENTNYSAPVMCQGQSEMVHSDMVMSAQTQQNQTAVMSTQTWESEMVHSAADLSTQTQQTQTVAHSNQKHHIVQYHQNLSVKSNEIKKLNLLHLNLANITSN